EVLAGHAVGEGVAAGGVGGDGPFVVERAVVVPLEDLGAVSGGLVLHAEDLAAGDVEDLEVAGRLLGEAPLLVGGVVGVLLRGVGAVDGRAARDGQHQVAVGVGGGVGGAVGDPA